MYFTCHPFGMCQSIAYRESESTEAAPSHCTCADEATSALDNVSQKIVSDNLDKMLSTRIVIAHRMSTIRHCIRIIVLDKGHIVEEGTFEQLKEKGGAVCGND